MSYGYHHRTPHELARLLAYHAYLHTPQGKLDRFLDLLKSRHVYTAATGTPPDLLTIGGPT